MTDEPDDSPDLTSAMRDEETWWAAEEMSTEKGRRVLREFLRRQESEDAEASRMLDELLLSQDRFERAGIRRNAKFRTGGVVRLLCEATRTLCDCDPRFALVLSETACVIAEALPDEYYPARAVEVLRGTSWKEYSTTCRYLGRFHEASEALDRAQRAYERLRDSDAYLASIDLARAILFWFHERDAEAFTLARSAALRYERRGETTHYFEAKEVEAMILCRLGNDSAAREIYKANYELADEIDDVEMKARTARNLGILLRNGGDIATASKYFFTALQLYEGLGLRVMVAQTRWSIAWLAMAVGNFEEAAKRFPEIVAGFTMLEMSFDAAMARLDLAEAFVMSGQFDEAYPICSELVAYFGKASLFHGALTAAALLKEAVANRTLTREHIHEVRSQLRREPNKGNAHELFLLA